jgi:hypothetical protein
MAVAKSNHLNLRSLTLTDKQTESLRNILDQGTHITALDALNWFGCFRLAARVYDLKQEGYNIEKYTQVNDIGKRITYYYKA